MLMLCDPFNHVTVSLTSIVGLMRCCGAVLAVGVVMSLLFVVANAPMFRLKPA